MGVIGMDTFKSLQHWINNRHTTLILKEYTILETLMFLVVLEIRLINSYETFKAPTFKKAVEHVNSIFGENYTTYNVENHLRTLKDKWKLICEAKKLSGARWDEESKMISLDTTTYAELIKRHPKYKPYLNCPIPRYEELRIICGEDHATGEFRETSYDPDIDKEIPTININEDDLIDIPSMDGVRVSQFNGVEPSSIFVKPGTVSGKSSRPVKKKKREDPQIIIGEKLMEEMGKVAAAIVGLKERTWVEVLADKVFGFQDISIDDLELVFDEYYKNEVEAKVFMVLPEPIQRKRILNMLERIGRRPTLDNAQRETTSFRNMDSTP